MKNRNFLAILAYITIVLVGMTAFACSSGGNDDEPEKPPVVTPDTEKEPSDTSKTNPSNPSQPTPTDVTLTLSQSTVFWANAEACKQSIMVTTNASSWTAESNQAWCKTAKDGNMLTLTAGANPDKQVRVAIVTVKATGSTLQRTVTVTQSAGASGSWLNPTQSTIIVPSTGTYGVERPGISEMSVRVTTNLKDWTCRSDQEWCEVHCDATKVYIFANPYQGDEERAAVVTLSHEGMDYSQFTVRQSAYTSLQVAFPDGQVIPITGGTIRVKVYTNVSEWTATAASKDCWFTMTKTDANTLTITAPARQGSTQRQAQEVTITAEKDKETFTIYESVSTNESYGYGDVTEWDD